MIIVEKIIGKKGSSQEVSSPQGLPSIKRSEAFRKSKTAWITYCLPIKKLRFKGNVDILIELKHD